MVCFYVTFTAVMWSQFLYWLLHLRRHVGCFAGSQAVSFKPPVSWADVILDKSLVDMLFMVFNIFSYYFFFKLFINIIRF